jgi:hypothetical protein
VPFRRSLREFVEGLAGEWLPSDGGGVELGPRSRVAFTALYLSVQVSLIGTGGRRPDHAFAFQMFGESSTVRFTLLRQIGAPSGHGSVVVPVHRGEWTARDASGTSRRFDWRDRVRVPNLATFDVTLDASYGAKAVLGRMQAALDDVASHIEDDAETERLLVDATVARNGREPQVVRLASAPRPGESPLAGARAEERDP